MSYTPTVWETGDVITAEKLNNMESGIVGASDIIVATLSVQEDVGVLSKTFGEIKSAVQAGKPLCVLMQQTIDNDTYYAYQLADGVSINNLGGGVVSVGGEEFTAVTDADYPITNGGK